LAQLVLTLHNVMDSQRELGGRAAGNGRIVYCAGAVALTEPGPAAVGLVVTNQRGRMLAQRSHYLGQASRSEASAQALAAAARMAVSGGLEEPTFRIDDVEIARALQSQDAPLPGKADAFGPEIRAYLDGLPGHTVEFVTAKENRARAVALAPLIDWLPERTRRAENLDVQDLGDGRYSVSSERTAGQSYNVTLTPEQIACECGDFTHRGIPCKHLLAAAREADALDRVLLAPIGGR
jgi:hypothetical protein